MVASPSAATLSRISPDAHPEELGSRPVRVLAAHSDTIWCVAFSPDAQQALTASYDSMLRIWDVETGHERGCLKGHKGGVLSVAYAPDGKIAVSAGADRTLRLWDLVTHKELRVFTGHKGAVTTVAFAPDGK